MANRTREKLRKSSKELARASATAVVDNSNIKSVEFFSMSVAAGVGKSHQLHGAVVFNSASDILAVLAPSPSPAFLYEQLALVHARTSKARLTFLGCSRHEVVDLLEAFCNDGIPLPNIFDDNVARLQGLSEFQRASYKQACLIPHGETRSYFWLTERLKKSGAERAVGGALKSNPFPLFIPCHRVIKKNGKLGGFMGVSSPESWQLQLKRILLDLEEQHRQPSLFLPMATNPIRKFQPDLAKERAALERIL